MELKVGKSYKITTCGNIVATCLCSKKDRALFVTDCFENSPYIIWHFKIINNDSLECCWGEYYQTLEEAYNAFMAL